MARYVIPAMARERRRKQQCSSAISRAHQRDLQGYDAHAEHGGEEEAQGRSGHGGVRPLLGP